MLPFTFPENRTSYWRTSTNLSSFPPLEDDVTVDIGIVGGGITGITAAYLLSKEGFTVALIEANTLLSGTTGNTTAKITTQHGLIYDELIKHYGLEKTKLYFNANDRAKKFIKNTIAEHSIKDAKYSTSSSYLYTTEDKRVQKLENEMNAYEKLNIPYEFTEHTELPFSVKQALSIKDQAHFHPLHYLKKLIDESADNGVKFYERTRALSVDYSKKPIIVCNEGNRIICQYVIQASHYPFFDGQQFFPLKMYAERSYALLAKTEKTVNNLYLNIDEPKLSIRPISINDTPHLIVAGQNHRTGVSDIEMSEYIDLLASFTEQNFTINEIFHTWSAQDYTTIDKLPYIGSVTKEKDNVFVATGYRKWGMTNGTNAALLITDLILQKETDFAQLFAPYRNAKFDPAVKKLFSFNKEVAKQLIKGKFSKEDKTIPPLNKGESSIVMHEGQRVGVYKHNDETIYAVDTTCTHLGCELAWNSAEKSWDCPCHGSRFSYTGRVLNGPAVRDLKQITIKK